MEEVADAFMTFVLDGIWGHVVGSMEKGFSEGFLLQRRRGLMRLHDFFVSQVSGDVCKGRSSFGGRRGHMEAARSTWFERMRVVNFKARASRSFVEVVDADVLSMAAWRDADWLLRSGVLARYSFM
jgi:hypothetical protein